MAGQGPLPKATHQRERDTKRRQDGTVTVEDDGEVRGPELGVAYGPDTLEWYETWRRAPQAALFTSTDWQRLKLLAPIVDSHFRRPSAAALSEIRLNEERLGALYVDRVRAKIRIGSDEPEGATAPVLKLVSREGIKDRFRKPDAIPTEEEEAPF